MFSPIKTIVKNKGMRYYAYNSSEISFSIAKNESIEINGDLFTYIKQPGDIEMLLNNIVNDLLEVTYVVNSRFPVSTGIDVNMTGASSRQVKLLDKMIGANAAPKKAAPKKPEQVKAPEQETKSAVPTDEKKDETVIGFADKEPATKIPEDAALSGMFMNDGDKAPAAKDPAFGEGLVITEQKPKVIENTKLNVKVETVKAAAPEAPAAPAEEPAKKPARKQVK